MVRKYLCPCQKEPLHFPLCVLPISSFFPEETVTGPPRSQQRIKLKILFMCFLPFALILIISGLILSKDLYEFTVRNVP